MNDYDDSLLIIKEDKIEIVKNNIKLSTVIDNKIDINYTFYFVKKKILVIITNTHIKGIKIKDNNEIINLFVFGDNLNNKISNPIFVNENYLNDNEICQMFENHSKRKMFSILILDNTKIKQNCNKQNTNMQYIKNYISDIPLLLSKDNDEPFNLYYIPRKKNYFEIDEIKNELIDVKKRSFLDRKKKVIDNIEQIKNNYNNDIKQKYISLLCLLINDNTNVDLLKEYLIFIEKNEKELKKIFLDYFEDFEIEFNHFSKAFIIEENMFISNSNSLIF